MLSNGGMLGAYVNTNTKTAPGIWTCNDMNARSSRITTGGTNDVWPQIADANFSSVTMLSHFDECDSSNDAFTNRGSGGVGFQTIGGSTLSNKQLKFGPFSVYTNTPAFSGASILAASNAGYNYGSGDFTFEFWVYPVALALANIYDQRSASNSACPNLYCLSSGGDLRYFVSNADRITGGAGAISAGAWQHIAVCRASGTTRMFVNGTQKGSNFTDSTTYLVGSIALGNTNPSFGGGSAGFNSYYSDVRVTKGFARYTANFTTPTTPFPDY